jgi:Predicted branched-chain amino acid permease (azaleucine resistance)
MRHFEPLGSRRRTRAGHVSFAPRNVRGILVGVPFGRDAFLRGLRDIAPMMLGIAPFGLITGVSAASIGLTPLEASAMSILVFAGASQLAAIALLGQGAGVLVILLTTFMINLRMAMYSASIAPWLKPFGTPTRSLLAYLMTDQAYGFAILKYRREPKLPRREYYLGVAAPLWILWQTATLLGVGVGTQVPPSWQLEFAIPLTFLAMLAPAVRDRPGLLAALVGGSLSLAFATLPYNLGLVLGALLGITAGTLAERRWPPAAPAADDEETK